LKSALDEKKGEILKALRVEEERKLLELVELYLIVEQRERALPSKVT